MLMTLMCGLAAPAAAQQLAPTGVTLTPGDGQLTVAWTMPAGADGTTDATTLTRILITYNSGSSIDFLAAQSVSVIANSAGVFPTSYVITGLDNGQIYAVLIGVEY